MRGHHFTPAKHKASGVHNAQFFSECLDAVCRGCILDRIRAGFGAFHISILYNPPIQHALHAMSTLQALAEAVLLMREQQQQQQARPGGGGAGVPRGYAGPGSNAGSGRCVEGSTLNVK